VDARPERAFGCDVAVEAFDGGFIGEVDVFEEVDGARTGDAGGFLFLMDGYEAAGALFDELGDAFRSLTQGESGAPAVERVVRFDRLFGRPADGSLPDLCVVWSDAERLSSLRLGDATIEAPTGDVRTGQHRHIGFLIGAGPGIAADREESSANLLDVAPTALALLGVDVPPALPGRPIEVFAGTVSRR